MSDNPAVAMPRCKICGQICDDKRRKFCSRDCYSLFRSDEAGWTYGREQRLCKLWMAGYSTREIGEVLRISRNAVIGKAHRLELEYHKTAALFNPELRASI